MNRLPYNESHDIDVAISNLTISSQAIAKLADSYDNMNSDLSFLLGMMALEMRSQAKTLKETNYLLHSI